MTVGNPTAIDNLLMETGLFRFRPYCFVLSPLSAAASHFLLLPTPFQITGVILLAVGVWGKLTLGTYISLIAENSTNAPYVLIGTGTTIVVFGLFGCFATCRGSPWMLKLVSTSQHHTAFSIPFYKKICHMKVKWPFLKPQTRLQYSLTLILVQTLNNPPSNHLEGKTTPNTAWHKKSSPGPLR